jgi:hypothetical protein
LFDNEEIMNTTKAGVRFAEAKRSYERLKTKHDDTIKLLVRLYGQLRKAERAVDRASRAVRQERKDTKVVMAQVAQETREFRADLGHLDA